MNQEIQKTSNQTFLITQENWQQGWQIIPVRADTPSAQIIGLNTPALSELGKEYADVMCGETIFGIHIALAAAFLGGNWEKPLIDECAQLAYYEFYWLNLAELKQFFLRLKTGFYRSNKNFSPAVFMDFLREYAFEREGARYLHFSQQKPTANLHTEAKPLTDDQMNYLKEIVESITKEMGEPVRQIESEEEYQKIRSAYLTKQMQQKLKDNQP